MFLWSARFWTSIIRGHPVLVPGYTRRLYKVSYNAVETGPGLIAHLISKSRLEVCFDDQLIVRNEAKNQLAAQHFSQKRTISLVTNLVADQADPGKPDIPAQFAYAGGCLNAALARFHDSDQPVHGFGSPPAQVFNPGLHIHYDHFITSQY